MQVLARGRELWEVARTKLGTGMEEMCAVKSFRQGAGEGVEAVAILAVVVNCRW